MLEENVLTAWSIYLLGVAGIILVFWRMIRPVPWPRLRRQLLAVILVLLVYPFDVGDGYTDLAPAILMVLMETVFEGGEAFNRVGPSLMAITAATVVVLGVIETGIYLWCKKRRQHSAKEEKETPVADSSPVENS